MFSAIAFMPTFLQMSSGLSAANSGLLMLPMTAGIIVTIQGSASFIAKTGRYKIFTVAGVVVITAAMIWMTTLSGRRRSGRSGRCSSPSAPGSG